MDEGQRKQIQAELIMTLATTLLFLFLYWWTALPEWKQQMFLMELRKRLSIRALGDGLSLHDRLTIAEFKMEMSQWDNARKRNNGVGTRDHNEEGH